MGERLKPLTNITPKSLLSVREKPFLEYQFNYLKKQDISNFVLAVAYKKEQIKEYFGNGKDFGINIVYSESDEPQGTAGEVKKSESLIVEDDFFVLNGDSFLELNLKEMFNFHKKRNNFITIAVKEIENADRYGKMTLQGDKVVNFTEKEKITEKGFINAGVYIFNRDIFKIIPKDKKVSLEKEIFPQHKEKISAFISDGYFIDMGTLKDYQKIQNDKNFYDAINKK